MNTTVPTYSPGIVTINWLTHTFVGLAKTFFDLTPNSDVLDYEVGGGGDIAKTLLVDKTASLTINLQQTSPTNHVLADVLAYQESIGELVQGPLRVQDPSGSVFATMQGVSIKTPANIGLGETQTGVNPSWVFHIDRVAYHSTAIQNASNSSQILQALSDIGITVPGLGGVAASTLGNFTLS